MRVLGNDRIAVFRSRCSKVGADVCGAGVPSFSNQLRTILTIISAPLSGRMRAGTPSADITSATVLVSVPLAVARSGT